MLQSLLLPFRRYGVYGEKGYTASLNVRRFSGCERDNASDGLRLGFSRGVFGIFGAVDR